MVEGQVTEGRRRHPPASELRRRCEGHRFRNGGERTGPPGEIAGRHLDLTKGDVVRRPPNTIADRLHKDVSIQNWARQGDVRGKRFGFDRDSLAAIAAELIERR